MYDGLPQHQRYHQSHQLKNKYSDRQVRFVQPENKFTRCQRRQTSILEKLIIITNLFMIQLEIDTTRRCIDRLHNLFTNYHYNYL